jgi:flagellar protein FliT
MLYFLRICAGLRRRFFLSVGGKLSVDSPFNRPMPAGRAPLDFVFETNCDPSPVLHREDGSRRERRGAAITRSQLLDHYEQIAQASQLMLDAARNSDWDEVERQEGRCRALVASLKAASAASPLLRPQDNRRRMELLRRMLAADAEIRGRSEPWLRQLEQLISSPRPHR